MEVVALPGEPRLRDGSCPVLAALVTDECGYLGKLPLSHLQRLPLPYLEKWVADRYGSHDHSSEPSPGLMDGISALCKEKFCSDSLSLGFACLSERKHGLWRLEGSFCRCGVGVGCWWQAQVKGPGWHLGPPCSEPPAEEPQGAPSPEQRLDCRKERSTGQHPGWGGLCPQSLVLGPDTPPDSALTLPFVTVHRGCRARRKVRTTKPCSVEDTHTYPVCCGLRCTFTWASPRAGLL